MPNNEIWWEDGPFTFMAMPRPGRGGRGNGSRLQWFWEFRHEVERDEGRVFSIHYGGGLCSNAAEAERASVACRDVVKKLIAIAHWGKE
jgi:hypothetical protein